MHIYKYKGIFFNLHTLRFVGVFFSLLAMRFDDDDVTINDVDIRFPGLLEFDCIAPV